MKDDCLVIDQKCNTAAGEFLLILSYLPIYGTVHVVVVQAIQIYHICNW